MEVRVEESIEIAVPPSVVYDAVTNVADMGRWSPECTGGTVKGGDILDRQVKPGMRFTGTNASAKRRWTTHCTVTAAERGQSSPSWPRPSASTSLCGATGSRLSTSDRPRRSPRPGSTSAAGSCHRRLPGQRRPRPGHTQPPVDKDHLGAPEGDAGEGAPGYLTRLATW
ncbi:SRPBCC family protein [Streptomyces thinghirensis]|nr:SRPBCC family protein [Streptomyces thinghirensis]